MSLLPTNNSRKVRAAFVNAMLPYLPQILNSGTNLVRGIAQQYRAQSTPPQPLPMPQRAPRRRRRRNRRTSAVPRNLAAADGRIRLRDSETSDLIGRTLVAINLTGGLSRLASINGLYSKHRIYSLTIRADGLLTKSDGVFAVGVASGGTRSTINSVANIAKLVPARYVNSSKTVQFAVPAHMLDTGWTESTVVTVYAMATVESAAILRITYDVEFDSPHP